MIHRGGLETEIRNGGSRIVNVQHRKDYVKGYEQRRKAEGAGGRHNTDREGVRQGFGDEAGGFRIEYEY